MMVKVYKYSIKSEAEIHGYTIKKLFRRNLKISQKRNLFMDLFLNKVTGLHTDLKKKKKKAPVHVFSSKLCQIF